MKKPTTEELKVQWRKWWKTIRWFAPDKQETTISFGAYKAGFDAAIRAEAKRKGKR